jgi:hypothetical protein
MLELLIGGTRLRKPGARGKIDIKTGRSAQIWDLAGNAGASGIAILVYA